MRAAAALLLISTLLHSQAILGTRHRRVWAATWPTYSDSFAGTLDTALATHDANWTSMDATYVVANLKLTGTGAAYTKSGALQGGAYYAASASDTSQITINASTLGTKYVCVRSGTGILGYCVNLGSPSGGNWTSATITKNGVFLSSQASLLSLSQASDLTVKLVASGTTTVTLQVTITGNAPFTKTDASSPLGSGHPGFRVNGSTPVTLNYMSAWQDH